MSLARQVASLGLGARNTASIKVRQPLARVLVFDGAKRTLSQEMIDIIIDELNVKQFEFVADPGHLVSYQVLPDNKLLGPRFGAQFPKVRTALAAADPSVVASSVLAGEPVMVEVDGQKVELAPAEVIVQTHPAEGLAVAADRQVTVAIDAVLTPELQAEGVAREIVRRLQQMRKDAGFNIEDRITAYYQADPATSAVIASWASYICSETLAVSINYIDPPQDAYTEKQKLESADLTLGVRRVSAA